MPDGGTSIAVARPGDPLLPRYDRLLQPQTYFNAETIPDACLPALRREIEVGLRPAALEDVKKAVAILIGSFKRADVIESPTVFVKAMTAELSIYPAEIIDQAISKARRTLKWLPAIAEMVEICDSLMAPQRDRLRYLERAEQESARRRELAAQEEERRREHEADIAKVEIKLASLGALAPEPGDYEHAFEAFLWIFGVTSEQFKRWSAAVRADAAVEPWLGPATRYMAIVGQGIRLEREKQISLAQLDGLVWFVGRDHEKDARAMIEKIVTGEIGFVGDPIPDYVTHASILSFAKSNYPHPPFL